MRYSKKEKEELDRVLAVFSDYIRDSRSIDVLYSDKLGYLCISVDVGHDGWEDIGAEPQYIASAEELCEILFQEIVYDVLYDSGKGHSPYEADAGEREEITRRLSGYHKQLPQYAVLADRLYDIPENLREILKQHSEW